MNDLIVQANSLLLNQGFEYAFCGGFAIDLFLGYESRVHSDIDVFAYWKDRDQIIRQMQCAGFEVYEMLGGGKAHHITDVETQPKLRKNIFCCKDDCELLNLIKAEEIGTYWIDFRHIGQSKLNYIEFLFNDRNDSEFIFGGNQAVRRELTDTVMYNQDVPFLAPEICLLYKSSETEREGYQQDYELAIHKMSRNQIEWLNQALSLLYPAGHKWMK